jgi:hypothetical protein
MTKAEYTLAASSEDEVRSPAEKQRDESAAIADKQEPKL